MFSAIREKFSRNLLLKLVQVTCTSRVCIYCFIPSHQYSALVTNWKVAKVSFYASVHSITQNILSHSRIHVSASSGVAFPVNLASLWRMKFSIVTGLTGGIVALGCTTTGCIASTILWITFAISSAPTVFLRLQFAIACARDIVQLLTLNT